MRKGSTSSSKSVNKSQISQGMNDSQKIKTQKLSNFEQEQKQNKLKKQKSIIDAIQSQLGHTVRSREERIDYFESVFEEQNLGLLFFENNPETNIERNKLFVDYEQINQTLNMIKQTKKDPKKSVQKESACSNISLQDVKVRMGVINSAFPIEELQLMFPPRKEINSKELLDLLKPNQIQKDPLSEALKLFLDSNGELSKVKLNQMMKYLGHGQLDAKEMSILKDLLDFDGDGKITGEDMREVFQISNQIYLQQQDRKQDSDEYADKEN